MNKITYIPDMLRGFSLIELVVVTVIVGIMAAIAIPSFEDYIQRSRRSDATIALMQAQLAQEQYRSENTSYSADLTTLGYSADSMTTDGGYYTVSITAANATSYSVQAVPVSGTSQATDDCGTFVLTQNWPNDLSASQQGCWEQ